MDPHGSFSSVRFPSWPDATPLRFPDRLLSIDGQSVIPPENRPNRFVTPGVWRIIEEQQAANAEHVEMVFRRGDSMVRAERKIRRIELDEVIFFFCFYALIGASILGSGVVVYVIAERRAAARAYAVWSFGAALFLGSFYDYHSTTALVPFFDIGAIMVLLGFSWLAWAFPSPPRLWPRFFRLLLVGITVLALLFGCALIVSPHVAIDMISLRIAVGHLNALAMFALVVALIVKLRASVGIERRQLRTVAYGLLSIPAVLSLGLLLALNTGRVLVHLVLPLLMPLIPLAIGYAIVKHDILHTRSVLSRRLMSLPLALAGLAIATSCWLGIRYAMGHRAMDWIIPAFFGLSAMLLVVVFGHYLIGRLFFQAAQAYRPTIEQLSGRLASLREENEIRHELEQLVLRWSSAREAHVLTFDAVSESLGDADRSHLLGGKHVRFLDEIGHTGLLVPMRFRGELCGVFRIGSKAEGALFTSDDIALLDTMAGLGAVALHHAATLREVDDLRRAQVKASRDERTRVIDTLSAEIAHELGHPLRYFKDLFGERPVDDPLSGEEIEFARLQVERMDRMLSTLEKLEVPPPQQTPILLRRPVEHALLLLRESLQGARIDALNEVPDGVVVHADHDPLVQVFANLLRNAAQAAGPGGRIGVRVHDEPHGGLFVDVWDDGPGISTDVQSTLFHVWGVTTRREGKGLGLMVCNRILKHLHWDIDFLREAECTIFRISIPTHDRGSS